MTTTESMGPVQATRGVLGMMTADRVVLYDAGTDDSEMMGTSSERRRMMTCDRVVLHDAG